MSRLLSHLQKAWPWRDDCSRRDVCVSGGVNNRRRPSQPSPLSRWVIERDGCDDGDDHRLLLRPGNAHMPRQNGSFLAEIQYGGRERSISPPSGQETRFAGFAVRTRQCGQAGQIPRQHWRSQDGGEYGRCEPGCVPSSQVCTPATRKAARVENSMLAQVCCWFYVERCEIGHRGCPGFGAPYDKGVS